MLFSNIGAPVAPFHLVELVTVFSCTGRWRGRRGCAGRSTSNRTRSASRVRSYRCGTNRCRTYCGGDRDPFLEEDESKYLIGDRPKAIHLAGQAHDLESPGEPDFSGYPVFSWHDLLECVTGMNNDTGGTPEAICVANIASAGLKL